MCDMCGPLSYLSPWGLVSIMEAWFDPRKCEGYADMYIIVP